MNSSPGADQFAHYVNPQVDKAYTIKGRQTNQIAIPEFIHIGRVQTSSPWDFIEHPHESTEFLLILDGSVRTWINRREVPVPTGGVYFVEPGQLHREESLTLPLDFLYLKFNLFNLRGDRMPLGLAIDHDPSLQLLSRDNAELVRLFEAILSEATQNRSGSKELIEASILSLFWETRRQLGLIEESSSVLPTRQRELVADAQKYLQTNLGQPFSLEAVASHCAVSPDYLSHLFKEILGLSPVQFCGRIKVEAAKELLLRTSLSVKEISHELGFRDEFYFSRRFKSLERQTPTEFRRSRAQ